MKLTGRQTTSIMYLLYSILTLLAFVALSPYFAGDQV